MALRGRLPRQESSEAGQGKKDLEMVKRTGLALRFVDKQTPEICMAAVQQNGEAL